MKGETILSTITEISRKIDRTTIKKQKYELIAEIKNSYDNRGLLVKQEFFNQTDSTKSELIRVYRFFYEETPLRFKFEKGELRRKEIEMNESYGRDY